MLTSAFSRAPVEPERTREAYVAGADTPRVVASASSPPTDPVTPQPRMTAEGQGAGSPAAGGVGADAWTLVQRVQGGDSDAFAQIYDRYVDVVYRYVYYRIGDRSQAEDFTSETFVRALRRLDSFTYQGRDLGAWLVTIARNIVFDHVKSSRYRLEVLTGEIDESSRMQEGPEHVVLERMDSLSLLRCVKRLGSEQQECIVLRFLQGLTVAETARIMGKNDGAIKALQHRAVRRLAKLLKDDE
ncbi:MAG: sigma-70 family RNA polymerase sigma factor [Geodermatophilaceae bacterium]|nr:sigma-70 family RNA polymerase sigma factor [Geodermatophilaceae bacterium]